MKIKKIIRNIDREHTWDISTDTEQYPLGNGCVSHNTSAQIANATNGIEPPRSIITIKGSKDSYSSQVVPEPRRLKNKYDFEFDQRSPEGYLKIVAVLQKFIDMAISVNTSYNPKFYPDEQLPMTDLIRDIISFYKFGGKNLYYFNTLDGAGEIEDQEPTEEAAAEEAECDSCVI